MIIVLVIFAGKALKCENVGSMFLSFNPCPSLQSVTKLDHYFWNATDAKQI